MNYLLDTCVISEPTKKNPDANLISWLDNHDEQHFFLSVISLGELLKGIYKLPQNSAKSKRLNTWVTEDLVHRFNQRIINIDMNVISIWGKLSGEAEKRGEKLPILDSLIAATAMAYSLTLVTRNTNDFSCCDIPIENPWRS